MESSNDFKEAVREFKELPPLRVTKLAGRARSAWISSKHFTTVIVPKYAVYAAVSMGLGYTAGNHAQNKYRDMTGYDPVISAAASKERQAEIDTLIIKKVNKQEIKKDAEESVSLQERARRKIGSIKDIFSGSHEEINSKIKEAFDNEVSKLGKIDLSKINIEDYLKTSSLYIEYKKGAHEIKQTKDQIYHSGDLAALWVSASAVSALIFYILSKIKILKSRDPVTLHNEQILVNQQNKTIEQLEAVKYMLGKLFADEGNISQEGKQLLKREIQSTLSRLYNLP